MATMILQYIGNLFVSNRFDGVELGRLNGGINSEQQSDQDRYAESYPDGGAGDHGGVAGLHGNDAGEAHAESDAHQAAEKRDHHRLGEELAHDVALPRADGAADSDLARALEHGG